jgi:hypothetical protein
VTEQADSDINWNRKVDLLSVADLAILPRGLELFVG